MAAFGLSRSFPLSAGILFVMGVSGAFHANTITTLTQLSAAEYMRGRVIGLYHIAEASLPLGFIVGGALAAVSNEFALVFGPWCRRRCSCSSTHARRRCGDDSATRTN